MYAKFIFNDLPFQDNEVCEGFKKNLLLLFIVRITRNHTSRYRKDTDSSISFCEFRMNKISLRATTELKPSDNISLNIILLLLLWEFETAGDLPYVNWKKTNRFEQPIRDT